MSTTPSASLAKAMVSSGCSPGHSLRCSPWAALRHWTSVMKLGPSTRLMARIGLSNNPGPALHAAAVGVLPLLILGQHIVIQPEGDPS